MPVNRKYIILYILLITNTLFCQQYLPPEVFSVENGLSSQVVNCLTIDSKGFLWAGTGYGLNRYDGYRFVHFFTGQTIQQLQGRSTITAAKSDHSGNIWIIGNTGINRYDHKTGEFNIVPLHDSLISKGIELIDVQPGENGSTWVLTGQGLMMLVPGQAAELYPFSTQQIQEVIIPTCLAADEGGTIWIGTTGGLLIFNTQQKKFTDFMTQSSQGLLSDLHVRSLYVDHGSTLWIGTGNGLNRFDPVDFDFDVFYPAGSEYPQPGNEIFSIAHDTSSRIVLSTGTGIFSFDSNREVFSRVLQTAETPVTSLAVDSSGIIWGGNSRGILKIRRSPLPLRNYTQRSDGFALESDFVSAIGKGPGNSLFIGYGDRGYDIADIKGNSRRHYNTIDGSRITGFHPFRESEYIVLSEHDLELVGRSGQNHMSMFSLYRFLDPQLAGRVRINCMLYDINNTLWLGTSDGLQRIRFDSAKHEPVRTLRYEGRSLEIRQVFDIEQDQDNNLWFATDNGLVFYNTKRGDFYRYTPYDKNLLNTDIKTVYTIIPESPEAFWIGTSGGAYRFTIKDRDFVAASGDPAFISLSVKAVAIDRSRNVWIGTERGLYYYRTVTHTLQYFDTHDGLLNYSFNAIYAAPDGMVYMGGQQGLSVINTNDFRPSLKSHPVVITGLQYIEKDPTANHIYRHVSDTLVLPMSRKAIRIDFAVLDLSRPEHNRYRYSIEKTGKSPVWYQLGIQNHVILDHLPPGKYIFRVTGSNAGMVWSNNGTSLMIIVEASYWRTKTALAIYAILTALLLFAVLRFWARQFFNLSKENQEREMYAKQIMLQKEELTLKNKSITDSINYAKRIQTAMLPPYKMFKSIFPSSFILYMPKDIVSGDFYWINKLNNKIFISAVDCTGHGVPGAFMSIIGFELFRKITNIEGLSRPSDILNRLNEDFHEIFKDVDNVVLRDGMDVAFCSIDKKDMILEFAGAFNPLYLIRDNKITEVKGDRFAIGLDETNFKEQTFKNHLIPIQKGDIIYIFSDGFADQFGGPDGKKYKYRRFRYLLLTLHQLPMEKQHEILENNVMEWRGVQDQVDDILVIGIKIDF